MKGKRRPIAQITAALTVVFSSVRRGRLRRIFFLSPRLADVRRRRKLLTLRNSGPFSCPESRTAHVPPVRATGHSSLPPDRLA
jgi:hypothetical protein